jgi:alpha-mannosidase
MRIQVNHHRGIFPLQPVAYKRNIKRRDGNDILLCHETFVARIDSAWLKSGENKIVITPLGDGNYDYDALTFQRASAGETEKIQIEPTIFFRKTDGVLQEICKIKIPFNRRFGRGEAVVQFKQKKFSVTFTNSSDFGMLSVPIEIPANIPAGKAPVEISFDGKKVKATCDFTPGKQWKLFVCPKVHNDIGYTDLQPHVNELDVRNTDTVLEILGKYPFYKFNFETSWLVDNYLNCRTTESRERFFSYAREGRAEVNALYLNLMTGICSGEELHRALYYAHRLHRERGSSFDSACLTDAPSHSWFLVSLLNNVGIKAFSNGSNQTRAPILQHSDLNENSPYYWEGMNGERILMWYARSYLQLKRLIGDSGDERARLDFLKGTVPQFLARFMRDDYAPDAAMVYGAYVDNAAIPKTGEAPTIEEWNRQFEFPKLVVGTDADYFNYIEKNFAGKLPVYRGDCGAYWEDGVGSTAKATTLNRQTQQILPTAETICSFASLFEPKNFYPADEFREAWNNVMFYDEHTWGAHNSIAQPDREFVTKQWEIKENYATRANLDARNLLARSLNRLCQQISVSGSSVIAFNWQNYARTEALEVEINANEELVDVATGKPMELDLISQKDGWRRVRFLAENVPAFGYKTFSIRGGNGAMKNEKATGEIIESAFYRLTIDAQTGGVKSLFDKTENCELVDANAPYKLNQYVYASGGENSRMLNHEFGSAPADLKIDSPAAAEIVENTKTSFGQRIVIVTKAKNTPKIRSEYFLYDKIKRVDIVNTVEKDETRAKEAIYFAFPFAAQKPAFEYQIQNGWVRPNEDQMPGACREWFTPQNVVHVADGEFSVAWATPDAPLATFTDINRGKWPTHLEIVNGHIFSYVMNNYWFTNYRAQQGGEFKFRYSITSGKNVSREMLGQFDADTRTPVFAYPFLSSFSAHIDQKDRPWPAAAGSFFKMSADNLQFVAFKEAEDKEGWILRLREIGGKAGEAEIVFPTLRIGEAQLCNGVEENKQKLASTATALKVPFKPNRFITVRIKASGQIGSIASK